MCAENETKTPALTMPGTAVLHRTMRAALRVLTPPPELTISDCADANRRLSSGACAEPGQWRTSRAEYQRGIMRAISDAGTETVVIMSSAQVGKALALDTPLPTPTGWTTMGGVQVGDTLFDETGAPCHVTAAIVVMLNRPCYRLRFSNGSSIIADADHLWAVDSDTEVRASRAMRDLDRGDLDLQGGDLPLSATGPADAGGHRHPSNVPAGDNAPSGLGGRRTAQAADRRAACHGVGQARLRQARMAEAARAQRGAGLPRLRPRRRLDRGR